MFRKEGFEQKKISRALLGIFSGVTISSDKTTIDFYYCDYPGYNDIICDSLKSDSLDQNEVFFKKVFQFYNTIYIASNIEPAYRSKFYIMNLTSGKY